MGSTERGKVVLAWGVHAYTALGFVLAAFAAVLVVRGGDPQLRLAFLSLAVAVVVDATDGVLARRLSVARRLPVIDGRRLDDLVDFHTYVSIPLLLLWRAGIPGDPFGWVLLLPLLAAAYGFSQTEAKTDDNYFLGFPSCWNVVAFYLYFLAPPAWFSIAVLVLLSVLTFVPTPYLYATHAGPWAGVTLVSGAVWGGVVLLVLLGVLPHEELWVLGSLAFPLFYLVASWMLALRGTTRASRRRSV